MANIRFQIKGKGICSIYVRFYRGSEFHCQATSGLVIPAELWSSKTQRAKQTTEFDGVGLQSQLGSLKAAILNRFNQDYVQDITIDSNWLKTVVMQYHKKDDAATIDNTYKTYFCSYIEKFIQDCKQKVNLSSGKKLAHSTILKYGNVLERLQDYERLNGIKLKHTDIDTNFYQQFISYLSLEQKYAPSTIKKHVSIIRTFCKQVQSDGITLHPSAIQKVAIKSSQPIVAPYLNEQEIQAIFNLDLRLLPKLEHSRDMFIIQLWTGIRVSDLQQLTTNNILADTIQIVSTQKTGAVAKIPIHPMVRVILNKRSGQLPKLCSSPTFNKHVKKICKLAGITQQMVGYKMNPKTGRKEKGFFPKYTLISSHSARQSLISNLYQKVSDEALKSLSTHKSSSMLHNYVKITQDEHVQAVRQIWLAS